MKQIALILASVLALGAASIAADADDVFSFGTASKPSEMAAVSLSQIQTSQTVAAKKPAVERSVRLISTGIEPAASCEAANWPYYPTDCLQQVETAGL